MSGPILNVSEAKLQPRPTAMAPKGDAAKRYDARIALVGRQLGAKKLGYSLIALPPGQRAYPKHNHLSNEEMFYVIEGSGELHVSDEVFPVRAGDIIASLPGGKETAHQIVNTGNAEMRYLAVSTMISPDIVDYPKTGKFGVLAERPPGPDGKPRMFAFIGRESDRADYWEGE
jgi:uncharacterized cupin superfamily protein